MLSPWFSAIQFYFPCMGSDFGTLSNGLSDLGMWWLQIHSSASYAGIGLVFQTWLILRCWIHSSVWAMLA